MDVSQHIIWSPGVKLEDIEKMVILKAFAFYRNHKAATANALGIAIRTLDNKLARYEQEAQQFEDQQAAQAQTRLDFLARARGNPPNNVGAIYTPMGQPSMPVSTILNTAAPEGKSKK